MADTPEGFEAIADRLYGLKPDEFAEARDTAVKQARAEKQRDLAAALAKLRRPTVSAWVVNLLHRGEPELVDEYLDLAGDLAHATEQADVAALQRLANSRRNLERSLVRAARRLAEAASGTVNGATEREVQETLNAALALPDVAADLRAGRLLKPTNYAGFGLAPMVAVAPPPVPTHPAPPPAATAPVAAPTTAKGGRADTAKREAAARKAREQAEQQVSAASAAEQAAATTLAERSAALVAARRQVQTLRAQVAEAETRLAALRNDLEAAEDAATAADRDQSAAAEGHQRAETTLTTAREALAALPD